MRYYTEIKSYDELVTFQRMMARDYPYFPIAPKDWDKLQPETITVKGLERLEILRSLIKMGKKTPPCPPCKCKNIALIFYGLPADMDCYLKAKN